MKLYEIENHTTGNTAIVSASNEKLGHEYLTELGYECVSRDELYVGTTEKGHEISVIPVDVPHISTIIKVNQKG